MPFVHLTVLLKNGNRKYTLENTVILLSCPFSLSRNTFTVDMKINYILM